MSGNQAGDFMNVIGLNPSDKYLGFSDGYKFLVGPDDKFHMWPTQTGAPHHTQMMRQLYPEYDCQDQGIVGALVNNHMWMFDRNQPWPRRENNNNSQEYMQMAQEWLQQNDPEALKRMLNPAASQTWDDWQHTSSTNVTVGMDNYEPYATSHKGILYNDGEFEMWPTNQSGSPHHSEGATRGRDEISRFCALNRNGQAWVINAEKVGDGWDFRAPIDPKPAVEHMKSWLRQNDPEAYERMTQPTQDEGWEAFSAKIPTQDEWQPPGPFAPLGAFDFRRIPYTMSRDNKVYTGAIGDYHESIHKRHPASPSELRTPHAYGSGAMTWLPNKSQWTIAHFARPYGSDGQLPIQEQSKLALEALKQHPAYDKGDPVWDRDLEQWLVAPETPQDPQESEEGGWSNFSRTAANLRDYHEYTEEEGRRPYEINRIPYDMTEEGDVFMGMNGDYHSQIRGRHPDAELDRPHSHGSGEFQWVRNAETPYWDHYPIENHHSMEYAEQIRRAVEALKQHPAYQEGDPVYAGREWVVPVPEGQKPIAPDGGWEDWSGDNGHDLLRSSHRTANDWETWENAGTQDFEYGQPWRVDNEKRRQYGDVTETWSRDRIPWLVDTDTGFGYIGIPQTVDDAAWTHYTLATDAGLDWSGNLAMGVILPGGQIASYDEYRKPGQQYIPLIAEILQSGRRTNDPSKDAELGPLRTASRKTSNRQLYKWILMEDGTHIWPVDSWDGNPIHWDYLRNELDYQDDWHSFQVYPRGTLQVNDDGSVNIGDYREAWNQPADQEDIAAVVEGLKKMGIEPTNVYTGDNSTRDWDSDW